MPVYLFGIVASKNCDAVTPLYPKFITFNWFPFPNDALCFRWQKITTGPISRRPPLQGWVLFTEASKLPSLVSRRGIDRPWRSPVGSERESRRVRLHSTLVFCPLFVFLELQSRFLEFVLQCSYLLSIQYENLNYHVIDFTFIDLCLGIIALCMLL